MKNEKRVQHQRLNKTQDAILSDLLTRLRAAVEKSRSGEIGASITLNVSVSMCAGYDKEELATMTTDRLAAGLIELFHAHPASKTFGDMVDNIIVDELSDLNTGEELFPMSAARVRELFPDAEIDKEGFFSRSPLIQMLPSMGMHINATCMPLDQWEAIMYWYQHRQEF